MMLTIDTTSAASVRVLVDNLEVPLTSEVTGRRDTVAAVARALEKTGKNLPDITEITVLTGPGSFTGIRVGIAVARTLGLILNVPVNGRPATDPIEPVYEPSKFD